MALISLVTDLKWLSCITVIHFPTKKGNRQGLLRPQIKFCTILPTIIMAKIMAHTAVKKCMHFQTKALGRGIFDPPPPQCNQVCHSCTVSENYSAKARARTLFIYFLFRKLRFVIIIVHEPCNA